MSRDLLQIGKALSAPARVAMITTLFDGVEHTAGELARTAGVHAAAASEHLAVLTGAGVVSVRDDGRHRRYRLADADIAHALEELSQGDPGPKVTSLKLSAEQRRVRAARTCYDHLAGQLGVAVAARFVELGWVDPSFATVTPLGVEQVQQRLEIDLVPAGSRPLLRSCTDWTERRPHLAGSLGASLATAFLDRRWVLRKNGSRGLVITEPGRSGLALLGVAL